jgi:cytochrome oxidase Cu insertion factor (SCO1/SenC/PrrC family)
MSTRLRYLILILGLVAALAIGYGVSRGVVDHAGPPAGAVAIGGPFSLIDDQGKPRTDADYRGKLMLVYFGYTYCPDVCPTTLQIMGQALDQLGGESGKVAALFITVDPARDTTERLNGYAEQFNPQMIGLTGSAEQIAAAAKSYRVYYKKAGDGFDYLMDHSSIVYLMDRDGHYLTHFTVDATADQIAAALRKHL